MTPLLALLFAVSVACDVAGQLCFKRGVDALPEDRFWRSMPGSPWLLAGVTIYGLELAVWLAILARAPLSLAFPLASLNYCGVVLASRFVLGESVSRRRWLGAGLITLGAVILATGCFNPHPGFPE